MNQSFTYRGEITGSINKKGKVVSFLKGHNKGLMGLQKLFALALSYKINEIPKFIPKAVMVIQTSDGKDKKISLPIPISGLRFVESSEDTYPKYSIEFEAAIPFESLTTGSSSIDPKQLTIVLINSLEDSKDDEDNRLASFALVECLSDKEDKQLTAGLQIGITWKMYLDIGEKERSES